MGASAMSMIYMSGEHEGWLRLQGDFNEWIILVAQPRHFGGCQWYFACPATNRPVSVLWRPPGAHRFYGCQASGHRRVAYRSQFSGPDNRAHLGKERDEFAASHHSITSSARARSVGGTAMPSVRAVWWLMTNSNFVDCITGRSAGFTPLRMRPT